MAYQSEDLALAQFVGEHYLFSVPPERTKNRHRVQYLLQHNSNVHEQFMGGRPYPWRNPAIIFESLAESLILADLKRSWHFQREARFRWMQKVIWTSIDRYRVVVRDVEGTVGEIAKELCNKPTAFYWLQSAQTGAPHAPEKSCMSGGVFAAIYEEWRRSCVKLNIEFGHFLAAPVRVAGTGPSRLPNILKAHSSLCAQARRISLDMDNYSMHPLLPAVILICDRRDSRAKGGTDGFVSLREVARTQTVLVILTGGNRTSTGIHISLDPLKPFALPIERPDATGLDILRVPPGYRRQVYH